MTALEQHRETNSAGIADVLRQIQDRDVEFVYFQSVTISGRVVGKVVPASEFARLGVKGIRQHRTAAANLQSTREGELLGGGMSAVEYQALPDLDTFRVLPWDHSVARVFCRLYEPDQAPVHAGEPFAADSRGVLRRVHEDFTARTGLELRTGTEPEMTWRGPGLNAVFRPGSSPAYHIEHLEKGREIYKKVIRYAQAMGFIMVEGDYEDEGQFELNWMFDKAEATADRLVTYRQICKQVARELGIEASFMPKPATGMMGNGCHHNFSLWRDGRNALIPEGGDGTDLTEEALAALGGVLTHAAGGMLIFGSTVNSYKRYWDAGQFAPSVINWGHDNKVCTVRASEGRFEFRLPDAAVNPHLSHAALIASIDDGLTNDIDPGEPLVGDDVVHGRFEPLPLNLGEAIDAFRGNEVLRKTLGPDLADLLVAYRSDEWARFCGYVTDWEKDMYWEDCP